TLKFLSIKLTPFGRTLQINHKDHKVNIAFLYPFYTLCPWWFIFVVHFALSAPFCGQSCAAQKGNSHGIKSLYIFKRGFSR
ncbi:MAG: hypothetical protein KKH28_07985, partial [Elusimicrobia bacterium]|nr:hypothetical protein [Elusimicrobiota bacterium]